ncbi:LytR C-terminal domain-containing protein [Geodermatophilus sp. CPCC 206100]|uniref:LytR C-terminal domain-containing protein n=1 Tax=Geodermatophilus sp. CPCC 206100 TaxID=3020054 RepID=UPI003B0075B1
MEPPAPPAAEACPEPAPLVVDVVDATGDPAIAAEATALLAAPGVEVGTVSPAADPQPSGIVAAAGTEEAAGRLAAALGAEGLVRTGDVARVTVVLGPDAPGAVLDGLRAFSGLDPAPCPPAG